MTQEKVRPLSGLSGTQSAIRGDRMEKCRTRPTSLAWGFAHRETGSQPWRPVRATCRPPNPTGRSSIEESRCVCASVRLPPCS